MESFKKEDKSGIYWVNKEERLHRVDGPAIEWSNRKEWWFDGKRHRVDGPSIEWDDGHKEWHLDGKRHRKDGPAREWPDGGKEWWYDGVPHRLGGPAIYSGNRDKKWFVFGKEITYEEWFALLTEEDKLAHLFGIENENL